MPNAEATQRPFTTTIIAILRRYFGDHAEEIFLASPLLGYVDRKTRSANRGSKSRGAFANLYALYVVIEDYIARGYADSRTTNSYKDYEGARFSDLFRRQRTLPFGSRLQNHALNARLNDEFRRFYPTVGKVPIVRDVTTQRYWIQEDVLQVTVRQGEEGFRTYNIASAIIDIIDAYVATKRAAFDRFLDACQQIAALGQREPEQAIAFIRQQLRPEVDARIFEIISFAILKINYGQDSIWIGATRDAIAEESLALYKTGRTNANDGGIDFVMRPLGRFFQVTETIDVEKYFLDIEKVQRFPITFVVKSNAGIEEIRNAIHMQAVARYKIEAVVQSYMDAIEEIINIEGLIVAFDSVINAGQLQAAMREIVTQSKLEFDISDVREAIIDGDL